MNSAVLTTSRRDARTPNEAGAQLSRAASRLLAALADPGSAAIPDPTDPEALIVSGARGGVTLGRGSHPRAAAVELARHDLVEQIAARGGLFSYRVSEAGRARLKRAASGEDTAFADQHRDVVAATLPGENGPERVSVNAAESPLDWLRRRRDRDGEPLIDAASFEAGERLRRDLTQGGVLPSVTARWDAVGRGAGGVRDPAAAVDMTIAARQRARLALDEVGSDFADLLLDLCGFLKGLETIERERGWPPRSGKVVVRLALRRLASHYGLETEARGPGASRGVRIWLSDEERAAAGR